MVFERFGAKIVHAFDLDPDMIDQARNHLSRYNSRLKLYASAIDEPDASFVAVFI